MSPFRVHFLAQGLSAGLMLAAAFSLPGCPGSVDGNPPRGSVSAPRDKESPRKGDVGVGKNPMGAKTKTKTGNGSLGKRPGGV
jgi:hypothetical protein